MGIAVAGSYVDSKMLEDFLNKHIGEKLVSIKNKPESIDINFVKIKPETVFVAKPCTVYVDHKTDYDFNWNYK